MNPLPRKGKAWQFRGRPRRLRATYHRHHGVMHMLAALDLATGKLSYRIRSRKRWIEFLAFLAEFAALRYFALNGTDHRSHTEQNAAIAGYVRWHNTRARPKVNLATDSPIRTWTDYPAKAA